MNPFLFLLFFLLPGCAFRPVSEAPQILRDAEIHSDTVWEGPIVIDGKVKVFKGATLTIRPGTEISFIRRDDDKDGLGDGTLIVEGAFLAVGTRDAPIRFRSAAADPRPGDWLEIRVDFSREVRLRWCEITDSAHTLHAHFTRGVVEDCTIRRNIDGCRLGQASFLIRNCLVEENEGKGINFRNSAVELTRNIIRYNGSGVFLFESDRGFSIHHNNIYGNRDNFRLGDFYGADVSLPDNWWGTADPEEAAATIYDRRQDPELGLVSLHLSPVWNSGTGPRDAVVLREAWRFETGAFVDAPPVADGGQIFVAGWDGRLSAFDIAGNLDWSADLRDVADAAPSLDDTSIYVQTWQREVFALDRKTGTERWRFNYPSSPADDHRQGATVRFGDLLLVPAWNGNLYALGAETGILRWHFKAGQPLRAAPVVQGETIYLAGAFGTLSALGSEGSLLWQADLGAPLLSSPAVTPQGPVVLSRKGLLAAFDRAGAERWRIDLEEHCAYAAPLYHGRALYVGTTAGSLWKIEAESGRVLWKHELSGPIYGAPAYSEGRLYLGDNGGVLNVLGAESGDLLATFQIRGEIQGTPARVGNEVIFGSRDSRIYALEVAAGSVVGASPIPGAE